MADAKPPVVKPRTEIPADIKAEMEQAKKDKMQEDNQRRMENEVYPVKKMAKGGNVSSASKRADGCCVKGKTKGRII